MVSANEFEPLRLHCKVFAESQAQISWRREDGKSLDGAEQRFRHQLERRPEQLLSVDSAELVFDSVRREQAGAYLVSVAANSAPPNSSTRDETNEKAPQCIASNGVLPGVSQRISVQVERCRAPGDLQLVEPCGGGGGGQVAAATETPTSLAAATATNSAPVSRVAQANNSSSSRRVWKTQTEPRKQPARQRQPQLRRQQEPRNLNGKRLLLLLLLFPLRHQTGN